METELIKDRDYKIRRLVCFRFNNSQINYNISLTLPDRSSNASFYSFVLRLFHFSAPCSDRALIKTHLANNFCRRFLVILLFLFLLIAMKKVFVQYFDELSRRENLRKSFLDTKDLNTKIYDACSTKQ